MLINTCKNRTIKLKDERDLKNYFKSTQQNDISKRSFKF